MRVAGSTVVITGATGGIGAALARRFAAEGAAGLCLSDRSGTPLDALAAELTAVGTPTVAVEADVADEEQVTALVAAAERELGRIDLFCANAGIGTGAGLEADPSVWAAAWSVNVMAHVHSARAVLPGMLARGHGWLLHTCSAAGLLSSPGDAPYAVTKHAAVAFAEWLSITYGDRGIGVSVLCPQGVRTPLLTDGLTAGSPAALAVARAGAILEPEEVADATLAALAEGRFHILPHPEVAEYVRRKATDPDRWLNSMRRLR
ncbi:SDR family oxidoreductase [Catellatospora tritici]|uniref:SDR family oxidoreductase n=1 Tax=Catellatospora tritici TaxID=2851566 RepID=UPI001C2D1F94|nr:SDR family oxidoreductase [Catellatospora tritici]MBV1850186.1 SDR family oxidoreductase [Catellatospora tritici]